MSSEQAAPETRGITTELLGTVDLGPEIEGMEGRQMRLRMVTMEPGGVYGVDPGMTPGKDGAPSPPRTEQAKRFGADATSLGK